MGSHSSVRQKNYNVGPDIQPVSLRMIDNAPVNNAVNTEPLSPPKRTFWERCRPVSEQVTRNFERVTDFSSVAMPFVGWLKVALKNIPLDIDENADMGMQISLDAARSIFVFLFAVSLLVRPEQKVLPENQVRSVLTLASAALSAAPLIPVLSGFALPFYTAGRVISLISSIYMYHHAIEDADPVVWLEKKLLQREAFEKTIAGEDVPADRVERLRKRVGRLNALMASRVRAVHDGPEDKTRQIQQLCDQFGFDVGRFPASAEEDARAEKEEVDRLQNRVRRFRCRILQKCISCLALIAVSCALFTVVPALNVAGFILMMITAVVSFAPIVRKSTLYQKSVTFFSCSRERAQEAELNVSLVQGRQPAMG